MKFKNIDQLLISTLPVNESKKSLLQRRINKLKRDPKGFLEDSYKKRSTQVKSNLPIKYSGSNNFTVVSAVYNVEKYLDEYFKSLVNQSLNFKKHIQLILVDDGSTDKSAEIIEKWQRKYPNNITYLYKENGGQASARNIGLDLVNTEWVTFIDPDDFVNREYFKTIDSYIEKNSKLCLLTNNIIYYKEESKQYRDNHPLKYRFNKNATMSIKDMKNHIQTSAASSFYQTKIIENYNIKFNETLKASFEDALFNLEYMYNNESLEVLYVKEAKYFYRKRADNSSTLDKAFKDSEFYTTVLRNGCLNILNKWHDTRGFIPSYVQRTVLYHLIPYFKKYINYDNGFSFLSDLDKIEFNDLLINIFSNIDSREIWRFNLNGASIHYRIAFLEYYKSEKAPVNNIYVDSYDSVNDMVLIHYFGYIPKIITIRGNSDNIEVIPAFYKKTQYDFLDRPIVYEHRIWVNTSSSKNTKLIVEIDNELTRVFLGKEKNIKGEILLDRVIQKFSDYNTQDCWLIMDRDIQADDNGEHFYRHMMRYHPEKSCYFALKRDSHDWRRLESEGFKLVEFGSEKFETLLKISDKVISSHSYATNYFGGDTLKRDFIFLQHGVNHNDHSSFFNGRSTLKGFMTSTYDEYNSLANDYNHYKMTEKEVFLTGMPRYDSLLKNNKTETKTIIVMPTWRRSIVGNIVDQGLYRNKVDNFMSTEYAQHWHSFLNNKALKKLIIENGYEIIFAPHAEIEKYLDVFTLPEYIKVWRATDYSIQKLFQDSSFMITDYSSVAFDMAYLHKQTIYYQFDLDDFYGDHYRRDYFKYEDHGFGPVVNNEIDLLRELELAINNNGQAREPFNKRIKETFAFYDQGNCERVYQSILSLSQRKDEYLNVGFLSDFTLEAYSQKHWELTESRSEMLLEHGDKNQKTWAMQVLIESLFNQHKYTNLLHKLNVISAHDSDRNYWLANVAYSLANWGAAIKYLENLSDLNLDCIFKLSYSYAQTNNIQKFKDIKKELEKTNLQRTHRVLLQAWEMRAYERWEEVIIILETSLSEFDAQELNDFEPQLLLSQAYRTLLRLDESHQQLKSVLKRDPKNSRCRIEIARLAFMKEDYAKCINDYKKVVGDDLSLLAEPYAVEYAQSLSKRNNAIILLGTINELFKSYPNNKELQLLFIKSLAASYRWNDVLRFVKTFNIESHELIIYPLTLARYRLGMIDEAYKGCIKPTNEHGYDYWNLVAEIALLIEDFELAKYCYKGMIAIFPNKNNQENWSRINKLSELRLS